MKFYVERGLFAKTGMGVYTMDIFLCEDGQKLCGDGLWTRTLFAGTGRDG